MQYWNPNDATPSPSTWALPTGDYRQRQRTGRTGLLPRPGRGRRRTPPKTATPASACCAASARPVLIEAVTADLIPGQGSVPHATDYEYLDQSAELGLLYHYRLEDIAHDGAVRQSDPVGARAGTPAP